MSIKRASEPGKREKARRETFSWFVGKKDASRNRWSGRGGGRSRQRSKKKGRGREGRSEKAVEIKRRLTIYVKVRVSQKFIVDPRSTIRPVSFVTF